MGDNNEGEIYQAYMEFTRCVNVTDEFLEIVASLLECKLDIHNSKIEYICKLKSGVEDLYSSYRDLCTGCDNSLERSIISMTIKAESLDIEKPISFTLNLAKREGLLLQVKESVSCEITGEYQFVDILYDELDHQIRRLYKSLPYELLSRMFIIIQFFVFCFMFFGGSSLVLFIAKFITPNDAIGETGRLNLWYFLLISLITVLFIIMLKSFEFIASKGFKEKVAPKVVFLFGDKRYQEEKISRMRSNAFWCVIIAFIVSFMASVIYGMIPEHFIYNIFLNL